MSCDTHLWSARMVSRLVAAPATTRCIAARTAGVTTYRSRASPAYQAPIPSQVVGPEIARDMNRGAESAEKLCDLITGRSRVAQVVTWRPRFVSRTGRKVRFRSMTCSFMSAGASRMYRERRVGTTLWIDQLVEKSPGIQVRVSSVVKL